MSSLPQPMRQQEEIMKLLKEQQQHNQDLQTKLQHHQDLQSAELSDMKRFMERNLLNLENTSNRSNSDPYNMPIGSKSKVSFQSITKKYFTLEILESFFGDVTTQTCKMIRYVVFYYLIVYLLTAFVVFSHTSQHVHKAGDDDCFNETLICDNPEHFTAISEYFEFMFAKKIASKDRHAYFSNENIADDVKRKTAKQKSYSLGMVLIHAKICRIHYE